MTTDKDISDFETLFKEINEQKKTIAEMRKILKAILYVVPAYQINQILGPEYFGKAMEIVNHTGNE